MLFVFETDGGSEEEATKKEQHLEINKGIAGIEKIEQNMQN